MSAAITFAERGSRRTDARLQRIGASLERRARSIGTARHRAGAMRERAERLIRDRPLTSLAAALGAGYILARLLR